MFVTGLNDIKIFILSENYLQKIYASVYLCNGYSTFWTPSNRSTVVVRWTAGIQVERSILHLEHGSYHSCCSPNLSVDPYTLPIHRCGQKYKLFI